MNLATDTPQTQPQTDVSVSLRKLVLIRWVAVLGQAVTVLVVHFGFGFRLPLTSTFVVIGASVVLNILAARRRMPGGARLGDREAAAYLAYDTLQLGVLLFLTGGLENPFAILMLAPVTVAATILSRSSVIGLSALTVATIGLLAIWHLPLPQRVALPFEPQPIYVLGFGIALVCSTLFIAGYAWSVALEARRMRDAYAATQLALAREQRVSAVGGLAAAAAHQLGSPLATIAVIAKELARDLPANSPLAADAELLLSQSERCRTILADLAHHRESGSGEVGSPFARLPFSALVEAAGEPHLNAEIAVQYEVEASRGSDGKPLEEPLVPRSLEIIHGIGNLIQNAIHFAQHEVEVTTSWNADKVAVDIADDGPGFPPSVLARIGEPYISARGPIGSAYGAQHMGLGIFIAQTLLGRTGARLNFDNLSDGGAHVAIEWRRQHLAAPPQPGLFLREAGG